MAVDMTEILRKIYDTTKGIKQSLRALVYLARIEITKCTFGTRVAQAGFVNVVTWPLGQTRVYVNQTDDDMLAAVTGVRDRNELVSSNDVGSAFVGRDAGANTVVDLRGVSVCRDETVYLIVKPREALYLRIDFIVELNALYWQVAPLVSAGGVGFNENLDSIGR